MVNIAGGSGGSDEQTAADRDDTDDEETEANDAEFTREQEETLKEETPTRRRTSSNPAEQTLEADEPMDSRDGTTSTSGSDTTGSTESAREQKLRDVVEETPDAVEEESGVSAGQQDISTRMPGGQQRPPSVLSGQRDLSTRTPTEQFNIAPTTGRRPSLAEVGESLFENPEQSIQRGGTASEAARNVAAGGLAFAFQNPDELNTGIDVEGRTGDFQLSGPAIESIDVFRSPTEPIDVGIDIRSGRRGDINRQVLESLSSNVGEGGLLSPAQEAELSEDIEQRKSFFGGVGRGAKETVVDITGSPAAGKAAQGVFGDFLGDAAAAPAGITLAAERGIEIAPQLPATVDEFGATEVAQTSAEIAGRGVDQQIEFAGENPYRFGGALAGGLVGGTAAANVLERGSTAARVRFEGRRGPDIDARDTTRQPETLETGEQPTFETSVDEPGFKAAEEMRTRAAENPPELQEATGSEQVLFRSESERLPDDLEAREGKFELPGLFASGDFPPLRTNIGGAGGTFSTPSIRLPRLFGQPQRASAFEAPDIDAFPESATGSGFGVRTAEGELVDTFPDTGTGAATARGIAEDIGGERVPDPTTPGAQFLSQQAERGTAFVRPRGSRTPEFEAIFPPETEFQRVTTGTINVGGDRGTLDIFRLADDQPAAPGGDVDTSDIVTAADITTSRRVSPPDDTPVTPLPGSLGTAATETQAAGTDLDIGASDSSVEPPSVSDPVDTTLDASFGPSSFDTSSSASDADAAASASAGGFDSSNTGGPTGSSSTGSGFDTSAFPSGSGGASTAGGSGSGGSGSGGGSPSPPSFPEVPGSGGPSGVSPPSSGGGSGSSFSSPGSGGTSQFAPPALDLTQAPSRRRRRGSDDDTTPGEFDEDVFGSEGDIFENEVIAPEDIADFNAFE